MPTLQDQIKLENTFIESSASRYYYSQDKLRSKRQGDQTDSVRYTISKGISDSAELLKQIATSGVRGVNAKYNKIIRQTATRIDEKSGEKYTDYNSLVFMGLTVIFRNIATDSTRPSSMASLKVQLANMLESDSKARLFEATYPGYYFTVMKSMQAQGVTQYEHIHKVLMTKFRDFELEWSSWDLAASNAVASKIFNAILVAMNTVIFKHSYKRHLRTISTIDTTVAADDWLAAYEKEKGLLKPTLPPMIIKPVDWYIDNGEIHGGYITPRMCSASPFIKSHTEAHGAFIRDNLPEKHIKAINKLQATAWTINTKILEIQTEIFKSGKGGIGIPRWHKLQLLPFPTKIKDKHKDIWTPAEQAEVHDWKIAQKRIYTENRLNKSNVLAYKMTYDGAREYTMYRKFYFVYTSDFRGRIYCATSGLSPQSNDVSKALLQFAQGIPLGDSGIRWLAIHGANTYGIDKVSYDDRITTIKGMEAKFRDVVERPLDTSEFWGSADKPWQFLSFIYEWAKCDYGRDSSTISTLPVGLDGSCNGIQHYSALLRDSHGGHSVNLTDSKVPSDIYGDVSRHLQDSLTHEADTRLKHIWLGAEVDRKLTKRPVMTLPYGATQTSAKESIYDWIMDNQNKLDIQDTEYYTAAAYLTPILWNSITETVIAARHAMQWIKKVANQKLKEGQPLKWISPAGFPVYQPYMVQKIIRVRTMMLGDIAIDALGSTEAGGQESTNYTIPTDKIDTTAHRAGVTPNFIHSVDSSHLVNTVLKADLTNFAMIHDDFGTHAANAEYLGRVIREEFVRMYTDSDLLEDWLAYQDLENAPEKPPMGDLDINEVLTSKYFFG